MRRRTLDRRRYLWPVAGIAAGCALASLAAAVGGTAVAQQTAGARAVFEATHLPPLLTLPRERIRLTYDVHCAAAGVDDPERGCDAHGTVFVRTSGRAPFRPLRLDPISADGLRQLAATVPSEVAAHPGGFEYYAELEADAGPGRLLVPAGGSHAPHRTVGLSNPIDIDLGAHTFGSTKPGSRVAFARWGDGPTDVGLEPGRNLPPMGASAFDVDSAGTVLLLDEAHRRVLRWESGGGEPRSVPLSIDGRIADLSVDEDGSLYVLESAAGATRPPLVRRFDRTGRTVAVVETAERTASQIRIGQDEPFVLQHPSHQWMPVFAGGSVTQPIDPRRRGRVGRPVGHDAEVVVLRRGHEVLVALVSNGHVERSWRIRSRTALAEVQLAEPVGPRLVLVVRAYTDRADEFVVLLLDRDGVVQRFSTPADDWAETAPLSRFRTRQGGGLYRLGSDASGAFVARYDLEAR